MSEQNTLWFTSKKEKVERKVNELIKEANEHGGSDNIAVVLIEGGSDDE